MHLRHLTHIRGFAAVWVLAFHYEHHFLAIWPQTGYRPLDVVVRHGYLGVDLFFVLSGFVISMSYAAILASSERRPVLTFIRNRVTLIYPLLMLTTLIAIAIWGLGRQLGRTEWGGPQIEATGILPNLVGIQQWVAVPSINSPSWSVSAELFSYGLFAVVAWLAHSRGLGSQRQLTLTAFGILLVFILSLQFFEYGHLRMLRAVSEFALGAWAYSRWSAGVFRGLSTRRYVWAIWIALALLVSSMYINGGKSSQAAAPVAFLVIVYSCACLPAPTRKTKVLSLIGAWSYAL